jgi:hypothetical protein
MPLKVEVNVTSNAVSANGAGMEFSFTHDGIPDKAQISKEALSRIGNINVQNVAQITKVFDAHKQYIAEVAHLLFHARKGSRVKESPILIDKEDVETK